MRLIIGHTRQDDETLFFSRYRSSMFVLRCHLGLTEDEVALVRKFKLGDHPIEIAELNGTEVPVHTIGSMRAGLSFVVNDPTSVFSYTRDLTRACDELLLVLNLYGQRNNHEFEQMFEYPVSIDSG